MHSKNYIVVVQCHLVKEYCSGYLCESAFFKRTGLFSDYPQENGIRFLSMSCGGCCGRGLHRKLSNLIKKVKKDRIMVHLSSCICFDSYHGPPCPHKDYLLMLINKLSLDWVEGSKLSSLAEKRRSQGLYLSR